MSSEPVVQRGAGLPDHAPRIEVGAFPPWDTNAYLVWDGSSPEALILDPGMNATASLVERAAANELRVHLIANSHGHIDHIYDNAPLKRATGAPLAIHPDDAYRLDGRNNYGLEIERTTAERELHEGERVEVGRLSFQVLHTPGHTEGSVCLYEPAHQLLLLADRRCDFGKRVVRRATGLGRRAGEFFDGHNVFERAWISVTNRAVELEVMELYHQPALVGHEVQLRFLGRNSPGRFIA